MANRFLETFMKGGMQLADVRTAMRKADTAERKDIVANMREIARQQDEMERQKAIDDLNRRVSELGIKRTQQQIDQDTELFPLKRDAYESDIEYQDYLRTRQKGVLDPRADAEHVEDREYLNTERGWKQEDREYYEANVRPLELRIQKINAGLLQKPLSPQEKYNMLLQRAGLLSTIITNFEKTTGRYAPGEYYTALTGTYNELSAESGAAEGGQIPPVAPQDRQSPAPAGESDYDTKVIAAAQKDGLDPSFVLALVKAESNFNPNARSYAGAMGLMQLMPGTARTLGVSNAYDPDENLDAGTNLLSDLRDTFGGNYWLAAAAYNAGPNDVRRMVQKWQARGEWGSDLSEVTYDQVVRGLRDWKDDQTLGYLQNIKKYKDGYAVAPAYDMARGAAQFVGGESASEEIPPMFVADGGAPAAGPGPGAGGTGLPDTPMFEEDRGLWAQVSKFNNEMTAGTRGEVYGSLDAAPPPEEILSDRSLPESVRFELQTIYGKIQRSEQLAEKLQAGLPGDATAATRETVGEQITKLLADADADTATFYQKYYEAVEKAREERNKS